MSSVPKVEVPEVDLRDVDICDAELETDEESGVSVELQDARFHHLKSHSGSVTKVFTGHLVRPTTPLCHQSTWTRHEEDDDKIVARSSIVDCLLVELYDTYSSGKGIRSADSLDSSTEASGSDVFLGRSNTASSFLQELQEKHTKRHQTNYLAQKDPEELKWIIQELNYRIGIQSAKLVRQVKRKDRLHHKQQKKCDIITACLQAVSPKRSNT